MTAPGLPAAGPRRWHPVTAGGGLLVAALAVAAAAVAAAAAGWPAGRPAAAGWLLVGASAGFATSGST